METLLILNGFEVEASVDEQEATIFSVASGGSSREALTAWLTAHVARISS
jgi:death-on-curing protein